MTISKKTWVGIGFSVLIIGAGLLFWYHNDQVNPASLLSSAPRTFEDLRTAILTSAKNLNSFSYDVSIEMPAGTVVEHQAGRVANYQDATTSRSTLRLTGKGQNFGNYDEDAIIIGATCYVTVLENDDVYKKIRAEAREKRVKAPCYSFDTIDNFVQGALINSQEGMKFLKEYPAFTLSEPEIVGEGKDLRIRYFHTETKSGVTASKEILVDSSFMLRSFTESWDNPGTTSFAGIPAKSSGSINYKIDQINEAYDVRAPAKFIIPEELYEARRTPEEIERQAILEGNNLRQDARKQMTLLKEKISEYLGAHNNSYGLPSQSCTSGIFANTEIAKIITSIEKDGGQLKCSSNVRSWAVLGKFPSAIICFDSDNDGEAVTADALGANTGYVYCTQNNSVNSKNDTLRHF